MVEFLNHNAGVLTVIFTAVVALSTAVYALLTAMLVKETQQMRRAQTEPKIEIVLKPKEEWINIIRLHLKNIGLGPAYDISFNVSTGIETDGAKKIITDLTEANLFRTGLKYLGPGQEIVPGFTQLTDKFEEKIETILTFEVRYLDAIGKIYNDNFTMDFSEFKNLSTLGKPHLYSIANSLEDIKKNIDHLATGWKRLRVDIYTEKDRGREKKEHEEWRESFSKESTDATKEIS